MSYRFGGGVADGGACAAHARCATREPRVEPARDAPARVGGVAQDLPEGAPLQGGAWLGGMGGVPL